MALARRHTIRLFREEAQSQRDIWTGEESDVPHSIQQNKKKVILRTCVMRNKASRFGLAYLAFVVMTGLGATVHTIAPVVPASTDDRADESTSSEMSFFDPFTLNAATTQSSSETDLLKEATTRLPVHVPYRPVLRVPIRPLLVQR